MSDLANYSAHEVLKNGCSIEIRALQPEDEPDMLTAVGKTSPQSLRRRFFAPKNSFSQKERSFFMKIDFSNHIALVALHEEGSEHLIVCGGRYIVTSPGTAELALIVIDQWQGRGIGSLLLRHLIGIAQNRGVTKLIAEVLPENAAMLTVFRKFGFRTVPGSDPQTIHLSLKFT
ncbi:MAG: GNAT family N-acetyltransferase [Rhizobiales bacterium 62-47]|nr:GNAT family N-acetyltransferase [Hyphomicrobiales bacterium]OJY09019.1 MAG: GNAT family N-acetyltransferase [Rhizobiales bacterium 62-47]